MKIAAYCRVSTEKDEQLASLTNQRDFFVTYAQRSGHELVHLYADEGISGTSVNRREEFKKLMKDAEMGLFQMVVVKDVSRFARNTVDALQSVRRLKALGINTLFLTANMDSMGDSEFVLTLFSAMAQEESANISKRTKFGKRINAEKGRVPPCVFGYDRIDNFTLQINPDEARIVRKIFSLYNDQALGCRTISMTLNHDGDKTKLGCDWNPRGVRRVLTNALYCGRLINHKYEIENFLTGHQIALPEKEQFFHNRPAWAIISPEVFQKTQDIMASRRKQYDCGAPFQEGRYSSRHIFSTLIKCAHCGRSFCRKTYTYANTRVYWRCTTNDQYTAERCENRVCLDEKELLSQLRDYFQSQLRNSESFIAHILSRLTPALETNDNPVTQSTQLESQKKKLLAKKERYQEMYANELMSIDALKEKMGKLHGELEAIDSTLEQMKQAAEAPSHCQIDKEYYAAEIHRFLDLETITNADLRKVIDHILVYKDGTVQILLKNLETQSRDAGLHMQ